MLDKGKYAVSKGIRVDVFVKWQGALGDVSIFIYVLRRLSTQPVFREIVTTVSLCEYVRTWESFDLQNMSECAPDLVEPAKGKRELLPGIEPGIFSLQVRCFTAEP